MKFELRKYHKRKTKDSWKSSGLKHELLEFEIIYYRYINAEFCELCNKEFLKLNDRQMDHDHETGYFRNICCRSCNQRKSDIKIRKDNKSGYVGIVKNINKRYKQGFIWAFQVRINGKNKLIKQSVNLDKLIEFAEAWKVENNYRT
tara:strand:+ start:43 stop:480 length:438 start_codon:yes stop_codon:yes gene_type:complete